MRLVRVAVPVPALDALTYSVPDGVADPPVGARVLVPLGNRIITGCVLDSESSAERRAPSARGDNSQLSSPNLQLQTSNSKLQTSNAGIKPIIEVLDGGPFLPTDVLKLATWVSNYYACGIGDAIAAAMPPWALKGVRSRFRTTRVAALTVQGHDSRDLRLGARQREALDLLAGSPDGMDTAELAERGIGAATLRRLASLGLVRLSRRAVERDPFHRGAMMSAVARTPHTLTAEQADAFEQLRELVARQSFQAVLLHGVTGSGKTELYLRLAEEVRRLGRGVLLLVPEIALTPAVAGLFRAAFGQRVAIQHSGLSDGERHDQWQRIRRGEVDVVVGTRSAVFAPLPSIGLIIVDEEHDGSYKQEESPRYHGRDVAVVRARESAALVVLGSATPAMESFQNAQSGRYTLLSLERRVLDRPMAAVRIVDMREEYAAAGPDVTLSATLTEALAERLERREQAIVLLNRRGFATAVF